MEKTKRLKVKYHGRDVGTMALYQGRLAAFEYDREWLAEGFPISSFSLPLEQKVFIPKPDPFDGLFGVFADSLSDGWGRLLVDRLMLKNHMDPRSMGNMDRLAQELSKDSQEVEKMYRLMCFNVFAHNRDDHSKNFTFLYEEDEDRWLLSPAYDLTYSYSIGGEHATTVHGNGRNPGVPDILAAADAAGLDRRRARRIAEQVRDCVAAHLGKYTPPAD